MNLVDLSDLEEGEILEYESVSPCESKSGIRPFDSPIANKKDGNKISTLEQRKQVNVKDREKSNVVTVDLESISSEGELKSEDEKSTEENENHSYRNGERKNKRRGTYGTVEDIMSEIGETISRCSYKRRKSKDFVKHSDSSYDAWRRKMFSSHMKVRRRKRKLSFNDSGSEMEKRRKRKRKRDSHHEGDAKPKVRDFDEVRRNLLEKLKKQKAEEELRAKEEAKERKVESTDIQEVDMLVDCTNYVDKVEEEKEDELDLIQLRLIALMSNKRQKETTPKSEEKAEETKKENAELDRNELLLRAEALKTALLKKHEKRLNRLKGMKEGLGDDGSPQKKEEVDAGGCRKAVGTEAEMKDSNPVIETNAESVTPKKPRAKRKKRKSGTFANNLKENAEKSDALEEDDRTLRNQLLKDLMKKKSLKDVEKKPILIDAIQTSGNKPLVAESPKDISKPSAPVAKTLPKKPKPPTAPKIPKPDIQRIIVHLGSEDSTDDDDKNPQPEKPVQAEYEKSVELLLSEARRKIEGEKRNATKSSLATPEAVYKHLPPSQRLEYIRLKQKIAERERLKKMQKNEIEPQPSPTPKPSQIKPPTLLLPSSQALISKLKLLLKKIKIEKTIEENYEKEMSKLKAQISLLEKKKTEQRFKIRRLGEESVKTYKAIQDITARLNAKEKKDKEEGEEEKKKKTEAEKLEAEGKIVSNEPETDISKAQTKAEKETETKSKEVSATAEQPSVASSLEYHSPFVSSEQVSDKVDPNVMLCQFDLTGICKDEECGYQHLRTS